MLFEKIKKKTLISLADDDYLFRIGVALYTVASIEAEIVYATGRLVDIFNLEVPEDPRLPTTGIVFEHLRDRMAETNDLDIRRLRSWFAPKLDRLVKLRNDLAHGIPFTDLTDEARQKYWRSKNGKVEIIEVSSMDELIELTSTVSTKLYELRDVLSEKKAHFQIQKDSQTW